MVDTKEQKLEGILLQKKQKPEAISLVRELGLNEESYQQLLFEIKSLDEHDEKRRNIIIGKKALEKKDYYTAFSAFTNAKLVDDKLYAWLGDKIVEKAEEMFDTDRLQYEGAYLIATMAFNQIKDADLLKEKNHEAAQKVLNFAKKLNPGYTKILTHAATFYHYSREDEKITELGDLAVTRAIDKKNAPLYPDVSFNNGILMYSMINDKSLFEKKVRETLEKLIKVKDVDFYWVEKCLEASRLGNNDEVKFDDETIDRVTEIWRKSKSISPLSSFDHHKLKTINPDNIEKMADEVFEREINNDEVEYDLQRKADKPKRNLSRAEELYNKLKRNLPYDKLRILGKKAEEKNEFSFAMWAYKKLNSRKDMDRVIQKTLDDEQFDALPGILMERIRHNSSYYPHHPIFQKGMLTGFKKALEKGDVHHIINLASYPGFEIVIELIRDDFGAVGDYLLEKAEGKHDFGNIELVYKRTEKALTSEKLEQLAQKFKSIGEEDLSQKVTEASNYVRSLGKDKFNLVKDRPWNSHIQLFFNLRGYLKDAEQCRENKNEQYKKKIAIGLKANLERISTLTKIKDTSKVETILNDFRHYKGSERLIRMGRKAREIKDYNSMFWALSNSEDKDEILKAGKFLLKNKEYDWAHYMLTPISKEFSVQMVSTALKEDILKNMKKDLNSGLELLLTALQEKKLRDFFGLSLDSQDKSSGHKSNVSSIKFKSKKLLGDFNIAVKVDAYNHRGIQLIEQERKIYEILGKNNIAIPRVLKTGKVEDFYVGVFEYKGDELSSNLTIYKELLQKIIKTTEQVQESLNKGLSETEKNMMIEQGQDKPNFYSAKITKRIKKNLNINVNPAVLQPIDSYLQQAELQKNKTITTDRHASNFTYNKKNKSVSVIDFNVVKKEYAQEDWVLFIDDPAIKTTITRDEMIQAYIQNNAISNKNINAEEQEKIFHHVAIYKNLVLASNKYDDSNNDERAYHHLQRAKESARKIGLTAVVQEIIDKLEPLYA